MECNFILIDCLALITLGIYYAIGYRVSYKLFKEQAIYLSPIVGYIFLSYTSMLVFYTTTNSQIILIICGIN